MGRYHLPLACLRLETIRNETAGSYVQQKVVKPCNQGIAGLFSLENPQN